MDRPTGRVVRRIHTERPGELVHVGVKKHAVIPPGGDRARTRNGSMSMLGLTRFSVPSVLASAVTSR